MRRIENGSIKEVHGLFDSQMLVVRPWFKGFEEEEADFNIAPLWIQVWNLPVHWISKEVGKR